MKQDAKQSPDDKAEVKERTPGRGPSAFAPEAFDPMRFALDEMNQLRHVAERWPAWPGAADAPFGALGAWPGLAPWSVGATPPWMPVANTYTKDDAFVVELELPGVAKDELEVFVQGTDCVVRGERKPRPVGEEGRPLTAERTWGLFERRFSLPPNAKPDEISAKAADGVLELTIPFDKEGKPLRRAVEIG